MKTYVIDNDADNSLIVISDDCKQITSISKDGIDIDTLNVKGEKVLLDMATLGVSGTSTDKAVIAAAKSVIEGLENA